MNYLNITVTYISKPNVYFSGDIKEIHDTVENDISIFDIHLTHAKDSIYNKISASQKNTIEIKITPYEVDTKSVITNYILLDSDFSNKTIYFTSENNTIAYALDYDNAKYVKNSIITIQQITPTKIVIAPTYPIDKKSFTYGVLLTINVPTDNTEVIYNGRDSIDTDETLIFWNYNPADDTLGIPGKNSYTFQTKGTYYVVVLSNTNLKFPLRTRSWHK